MEMTMGRHNHSAKVGERWSGMTVLTDLDEKGKKTNDYNNLETIKSVRKSVMKSVSGAIAMTVSASEAEARRVALLAGATTLEEQARRLLDAGEIGPEMAASLGVEAPPAAAERAAARADAAKVPQPLAGRGARAAA